MGAEENVQTLKQAVSEGDVGVGQKDDVFAVPQEADTPLARSVSEICRLRSVHEIPDVHEDEGEFQDMFELFGLVNENPDAEEQEPTAGEAPPAVEQGPEVKVEDISEQATGASQGGDGQPVELFQGGYGQAALPPHMRGGDAPAGDGSFTLGMRRTPTWAQDLTLFDAPTFPGGGNGSAHAPLDEHKVHGGAAIPGLVHRAHPLQHLMLAKHQQGAATRATSFGGGMRSASVSNSVNRQGSLRTVAARRRKLGEALSVMQECFHPIQDIRTKEDLIPLIVYSKRTAYHDFGGFYTLIVEKGDEIISAATIRLFGKKVAELPLVATRFSHRRQGMCRLLLTTLEQILFRLGVEKLVLPAVPDVHATWKGAFGFQDCSPDSRKELSELEIMVFPGTTLLQKSVADAVSNHKQTAISALVGATLLSVVSDSGAPEKAPANGVALPYSTRWELSEWEELARNSHPPAKEEVKGLAAPEERKPGVPTLKRKRSGISSPVAGSSKGFRGLLPKGGGDVGQPRHLGPSQGGVPEVYSSKVVASTRTDRPVKASQAVPDAVRHLTPLVSHEKRDSGGQRDFAGWEGVNGAQFGGDIPSTLDLGMEGEDFDHLLANAEKWWAPEGGQKSTSKASPHTQRRALAGPKPSPLKRAKSASPSMRPGVGPSPLLLPGGTQAVPMVGGAPSGSTSGRSSSSPKGKKPGRKPKITASPSRGGGSEQAIPSSPSDRGVGSQGSPGWRMKLQKGSNGWAVVAKGGVAEGGEQPPALSLGPSSPQRGPRKRPYFPPAEQGLEAEGSTHGAKAFLPSPKKRPQSGNGDYPPGVSAQTTRKEGPRTGPCWLEALLALKFFQGCKNHNSESSKALAREKECNLFCTDCAGGALCMLCLEGHKEHRMVQIRRSSYNDCVRISDIQRLLDYWQVQVYTINGAKIVFLNERPHSNPNRGKNTAKSNVNACEICGRCLVDNVRFCSVGCKLACIKQGASEDAALTLQPFLK